MQSLLISKTLMDQISLEGQHAKCYGDEDIVEVIRDDMILKGIQHGQVTAEEFLNLGIIGATSISLLTILAPCSLLL